jgi:two-component system response regulator PilR (NtrC family)
MARLLVVDDERSLREVLDVYFSDLGHEVLLAGDVQAALLSFREKEPEIVITDLRLGKGSGLDVLRQVKAQKRPAEVIVMTAYATAESGLEAAALGAYDFVTKTAHLTGELKLRVNGALEKLRLARENQLLRDALTGKKDGLIGRSPAMRNLDQMIEKVAPARTTVLVTGESGVGKELVARALHARGPRATAPFVPVNCGAIPEGLIESELFGHRSGACGRSAATRTRRSTCG